MPPPAVQSPFQGLDRDTKDCKAQTGVESMEKSSAATHVGPVGDEFVGLLGRTDKNGSESQQVFNEVLDQLTAQEDELGMQPSLYTLPSMTFLESLLDEMDSRNASNGMLTEPPMYLPEDSLELPGLELAGAGSTLEDLGLHSPSMLLQKPAYSCPAGAMHRGPFGFSGQGSMGSMGMMPNASVNMPNPFTPAPTAGSAAPSPVKRPPGNQVADEDDDVLHELNYSYETSKSGRCRKVSSFLVSGNKRKLNMISQHSAPAVVAGGSGRQASVATGVDINPFGPELTEVASTYKKKAQKNRSRSKTTVCLNCGSMDTPQWRVGPLGPRTLCNACGVRFKKGLPLSCYPLRNGMVLPPGATLPPSVVVPPGMNIITQPLKPTTGMSGSLIAGHAEPHPLFAGRVSSTAAAAPPSPAVLISDK